MKIQKLKCKRCGHEWIPRIPDVKKCPNRNCQSVRWNEDPKKDESEKQSKENVKEKTQKKKGKKSAGKSKQKA